MSDTPTPEEEEFLREWGRKRRARRRMIRLVVVCAVLVVIFLPLGGGLLYDRYWQGKVAAKNAQLRAKGRLLTFQEMLDRSKGLPPEKNSALVYLVAFDQLAGLDSTTLAQELADQDPPGARPSAPVLEMLQAEAAGRAQGLQTILSAASLKEGSYPLGPAATPWDLLLPHCEKLRRAALLCGRVALLQAAAGLTDEDLRKLRGYQ